MHHELLGGSLVQREQARVAVYGHVIPAFVLQRGGVADVEGCFRAVRIGDMDAHLRGIEAKLGQVFLKRCPVIRKHVGIRKDADGAEQAFLIGACDGEAFVARDGECARAVLQEGIAFPSRRVSWKEATSFVSCCISIPEVSSFVIAGTLAC